jgi:hypothetical protein
MYDFLETHVLPLARVIDANGYFDMLLYVLLPIVLIGCVILFKKGEM